MYSFNKHMRDMLVMQSEVNEFHATFSDGIFVFVMTAEVSCEMVGGGDRVLKRGVGRSMIYRLFVVQRLYRCNGPPVG